MVLSQGLTTGQYKWEGSTKSDLKREVIFHQVLCHQGFHCTQSFAWKTLTHSCMMMMLALAVSYKSYTCTRCGCCRLCSVLNSISTASRLTMRRAISLAASSWPEHFCIHRRTMPNRPLQTVVISFQSQHFCIHCRMMSN